MKIFIQILKYANKVNMRMFWFVFCSVFGVIFSAFNIVLIIPMLNVLFDKTGNQEIPLPQFEFSSDYIINFFNHYLLFIVHNHGRLEALFFVCTLTVACIAIANAFRFAEYIIVVKIRADLVRNIRMALFNRISKLDLSYFHAYKKGDIISRFTNDLHEVEMTLMIGLKSMLKEPITIIVYFSILFTLSAKLTLFTLLILPVTGGIIAQIIKKLRKQAIQQQESLGRIVNIIDETFGSMRIVKAFNAESFISQKMQKESNYYRDISRLMSYKNELASPLSEVLGTVIVVTIIFFGGSMVLESQTTLDPNVLLGFLVLFAMLIQPVKSLSGSITGMQKAKVSAKRIFEAMDLEPSICSKPNAPKLKKFEKNIEFVNVSFAYDSNLVLKNINLCVEKGKTVALVGSSGGGKSTLADLIPRFYDPSEGEVRLDGKSLTKYNLESIRQQIGVVPQEPILFYDTVFNNIAFGLPYVAKHEVIEAAKTANAHNFIMQMSEGYQTIIGDRGSKLSGGQKQRLSIARAILKKPSILILDEATSALDTESEKLVQEALFSLMNNRTSFIIAHRLSAIQSADEIIVIQNGFIVETGTHDKLMNLNGVYKKLVTVQRESSKKGVS